MDFPDPEKPVKKIVPKYPLSAEEEKIEGRVKVRMRVNLDGSVGSVQLVFSEPPGVFDDVVLEAAQKFILEMIKPDYNYWEGKEQYESRFLKIIENNFQ